MEFNCEYSQKWSKNWFWKHECIWDELIDLIRWNFLHGAQELCFLKQINPEWIFDHKDKLSKAKDKLL